ncbi:hypothetical protein SVIOM74S_05245 [Streptomyces violarus]
MYEADTVIERWEPVFHSKRGDEAATLLFLPLAHVFGRMVQVAGIRGKVKFGHQPQLNAAALLPDLAAFKPTFFLAVPYIFEKVFNAARRKARRRGAPATFEKAVDIAIKYADAIAAKAWGIGPGPSAGLRMQHQLFDKLVYAKIRAAMGGRIKHAMSGGSAMDRRLGLFFAGAGVHIYEGYGLTVHGRRDRQPARTHPVRHGRAAHPGHDRAHRGRGQVGRTCASWVLQRGPAAPAPRGWPGTRRSRDPADSRV